MARAYNYPALKGRLHVGDIVRGVKGKNNPCSQMSVTSTGTITQLYDGGFYVNGCSHDYDNPKAWLEIVKGANSHSFMENVIETFKLMRKSEPEKTFIKAGLMDSTDGMLTDDGEQLFQAFLLDKFGADFKTEVVDAIIAEQKREAKEAKESK